MKRNVFMPFLILGLSLFMFNCSSNENNPVTPNEKPEPQQPAVQQVELPQSVTNSSDSHAAQAVMWAGMVNSFSAYSSYFSPPQGTKSLLKTNDDGSWTYTWTVDSLVITLLYEQNAESISWKVTLNGSDSQSETVYVNWTMLEASQTTDGSSGTITMYDDNSTDIIFTLTWSKDSDGTENYEYINPADGGGKIVFTVHPENSGDVQMYNHLDGQYIVWMKVAWTASGGEWWEYDEQGNVSNHGSF